MLISAFQSPTKSIIGRGHKECNTRVTPQPHYLPLQCMSSSALFLAYVRTLQRHSIESWNMGARNKDVMLLFLLGSQGLRFGCRFPKKLL